MFKDVENVGCDRASNKWHEDLSDSLPMSERATHVDRENITKSSWDVAIQSQEDSV